MTKGEMKTTKKWLKYNHYGKLNNNEDHYFILHPNKKPLLKK